VTPTAIGSSSFRRLTGAACLGVLLATVVGSFPAFSGVVDDVRLDKNAWVPMRDGIRLATDLYFPPAAGQRAGAKFPVVLIRTPYSKRRDRTDPASPAWFFARRGYVVAIQDVRGRYESEGEFTISQAERDDGYDAVTWLASQEWSTGKVGTFGCSYSGESQILMAAARHPNQIAAIPEAASGAYGATYHPFGLLNGGAFELASGLGWFRRSGSKVYLKPTPQAAQSDSARWMEFFNPAPTIPATDFKRAFRMLPLAGILKTLGGPPTDYEAFVSHPPGDEFWQGFNYVGENNHFNVPALHVDSWYDYGVGDTLAMMDLLRRNATSRAGAQQFAIISPTDHCHSERTTEHTVIGERDLGDARLDYRTLYARWFDRWLKGEDNGITDMPRVQYYLMGKNAWRTATAWPPPTTQFTKYYLHSDGHAHSRNGTGVLDAIEPQMEPGDKYVYDPATPVPSLGGPICCIDPAAAAAGSYDQSDIETRQDVLTYTSASLKESIEVTGPVEAVLYAESSARDTDFTVKLLDVYPDGRAFNLQEGIQRARYRDGYRRPQLMTPGVVYRILVGLQATANYFAAGHRIRVEVSSSNFPRFDRNLNTGGNNYDETAWVTAVNVIHHSKAHPSHLVLPIVR